MEQSLPDLIREFESDVEFGGHSVRAEVGRSLAGQKLLPMEAEALTAIADHLEARRPTRPHVVEGWDIFLHRFAERMHRFPSNSCDVSALIVWARAAAKGQVY